MDSPARPPNALTLLEAAARAEVRAAWCRLLAEATERVRERRMREERRPVLLRVRPPLL
jgi:hypothetical protein